MMLAIEGDPIIARQVELLLAPTIPAFAVDSPSAGGIPQTQLADQPDNTGRWMT